MAMTSIKVEISGMAEFDHVLNERINAFEKAVEELAAMLPGRLQIEMRIVESYTTEGILDKMEKLGVGFKIVREEEKVDPVTGIVHTPIKLQE